jgi:L-lysine exporter family protein LysE/ArgO
MTNESYILMYVAITNAFIIGFCRAAINMPVNFLAIRRGIMGGFQGAFLVGVGASLVDAIWAYVFFAGFVHMGFMGAWKIILWGLSIVFALFLANSTLTEIRENPEAMESIKVRKQLQWLDQPFFMGLLIAATNPFAIIWWLGIVGTLELSGNIELTGAAATSFFSAVLVSELAWYTGLGLAVHYSRNLFNRKAMTVISWVCGLGLLFYCLFMLAKVVIDLISTGSAPLIPN